ncbi:hypothetical protein BXY66_3179 [Shimia isoporae]|uniref:DoxX-like protein n=1 Tax=Shimia isoporae TaxID=647720 RepID=A0A4R1NAU6_9RHOB|nr:hypothetical protein [Shimia isoporae]TCL00536.1 hypothetical protein BXY66_3179 [Shimia isoporae]
MTKSVLWGCGLFFLGNAVVMWVAPHQWFEAVPGVAATGGYNDHFIRDVAIAFAVSGMALIAGAKAGNREVALFGAGFPVLHAVFHVWIWAVHRGYAADIVALVNLIGIQAPAWAALWAAASFGREEAVA